MSKRRIFQANVLTQREKEFLRGALEDRIEFLERIDLPSGIPTLQGLIDMLCAEYVSVTTSDKR